MTEYGNRFLDTSQFLSLIKELKFDLLGISLGQSELEYLEKKGLLRPKILVRYPAGYVEFVTKLKFIAPQDLFAASLSIPSQWSKIHEFVQKLHRCRRGFPVIDIFHVFDKFPAKFSEFLVKPSSDTFRPWKESILEVSIPGWTSPKRESVEERYYSYWQAYELFEILRDHKVQLFQHLDAGAYDKIWKKEFGMRDAFQTAIPAPKRTVDGDYLGFSRMFNFISFYIHAMSRLDLLAFFGSSTKGDNDVSAVTNDEVVRYEVSKKRIAKITRNRFPLTNEDIIAFLAALSKKYFEYEEQRMFELRNILRKDMYSLVDILLLTTNMNWEVVAESVGRATSHIRRTIDVIFPDEIEEAIEEAVWRIENVLNGNPMKKLIGNVSNDDIKQFLRFARDQDLHQVYFILNRINVDWFSGSPLTGQGIQAGLVVLSVCLEDFMRGLYRTFISRSNSPNIIELKFGVLIGEFFSSEEWYSCVKAEWPKLTRIDHSTNVVERIEMEILGCTFHADETSNQLVQLFLICGTARNCAAHQSKKLFGINHITFLRIMNSLVTAMWLAWQKAISNGWIEK